MDHSQLISELPQLEAMAPVERIALAKERRQQQLIRFLDYDRSNPITRPKKQKLEFSPGVALLEATSRGDLHEVERLLKAGSDPNSHNEDGLTPLHQASYKNFKNCAIDDNENLVRILLKYNADVNAKDTELWTPLHAAACCGYIEIVKLLIANGADLLAVNSEGNMPYDLCDVEQTLDVIESEMAHRSITQELIEEKRGEPERQMLSEMKLLRQRGEPLDSRQPNGSTFLHAAAANGYYDVVAFLLRVGVQPDLKDNEGWTSLHAAAHWNQTDIIELLCDYGASVELKTFASETAFDLAEDVGTRAVIQTMQQQDHAKKKKNPFGLRDSRRQSKRKKKYESLQPMPSVTGENPFSARGAIRRQSLRDRSGLTPARLDAQFEQHNLVRTWSGEDVSNNPDDVSHHQGGRDNSKSSPNKRSLKSGAQKTKPMSPDEWVKKLDAENEDDDDMEGQLNRSARGRSGSRKKQKKRIPGGEHELSDMRGQQPVTTGKGPNFGSTQHQEKKVCCCTIL
uniref:Protein phosphatase 1 regulatory subunit 16A n=1 Tax=Panagrolaimus superbus TaxID=310955 RepID=A0A914Z6R5_9BILA